MPLFCLNNRPVFSVAVQSTAISLMKKKTSSKEIKNTEVEDAVVATELAEIVFDHVIKHKKIRCEDPPYNRQDYPYSRKLDDRLLGREQELAIHSYQAPSMKMSITSKICSRRVWGGTSCWS